MLFGSPQFASAGGDLSLVGHDGLNHKHILIDINTGEATDLGPTTFTSRFSGMTTSRTTVDTATSPTNPTVFTHPSGTIFGVYLDETTGKDFVSQVDTTTGKANKVVEVVGGLEFRGVAFGPGGDFFAIEKQTKTLYKIDLITGVKTIVGAPGSVGFETNNLQFDTGSSPARFLALLNGPPADIISISPTTGIGTKIGSLMDSTGAPIRLNGCALVKNPDDGRWFTVARTIDPSKNIHLFEIDVASGLVTDIGFLNQNAAVASMNICGLAFGEFSPAPVPIVSGSKTSYTDPNLGDLKHGQGHDNGFCMNLNCINVNGFFNHLPETTVPQGSTQTFTVLVNCPRGSSTCNHISLAGALPGADFYDDQWSATVNRETKSDNWILSVYNPFGEIGDDVTVTVQSVGQSFVTASFNIPFLIPGSVGAPDGIGDPQENNRHIHVTVWDSNRGSSNYIFNEGIYVDDIFSYPQIETSYEDPLEVKPLCLNENPNKRYTCAFDMVREWTIKNAEAKLQQIINE